MRPENKSAGPGGLVTTLRDMVTLLWRMEERQMVAEQGELLSEKTAFRPRLRLKAVTPSENEFAEAVAKLLETIVLPPAEWTCFPAGVIPLPAHASAKLRRFGLKRGWPDYLILHGTLYGLELKRADGKLSKGRVVYNARGTAIWREGQENVFPRLAAAGMRIAVVRTIPDVLAALDEWRIPMRRIT